MNKKADKTANKPEPTLLHHPDGWFHRIFISEAILSILLILCFVGIAYTDVVGALSINFWLWMIPVFAVAAIILEWSRYIKGDIDGFHFIRQQILHWTAVFIAVKVIFILLQLGRLPNNATAFVLMMVMSLSTFLAGIYIGWRFLVLGVFIAIATIIAAYLETYVWILIPVVIFIVAMGIYMGWREFKSLSARIVS
ncbi:hypothetical protein GCM10009133_12500 [Cocleimonas flava]|uniref:Uncharacterized protein n=1 Tax=Cocleimonas flava TaxID=634765 RepID=A0A4V2P900_9GAMM|nr:MULTISPECIES: hypothetical protein [Cocleimonas]MEB8434387.1 hypothetical protein [Cocleimonas sp. KMM 6892]MEC4717210.1 hypothetical protein [Cocleimonas sp. KMM 6895]MEC4746589.1 hypothetical protein [Cocleimonas sp. KMM 6896]TCJ87615.1 hypothetical protein EV695_2127 [Cocleimonas flava]